MKNQALNQFINFFWTILCFLPVYIFWASRGAGIWLYIFIAFSIICGLLPAGIFRRLQFSSDKKFYERFGIRFIQKFVQNGTLVNKAKRSSSTGNSVIRNREQAQKYINTASGYERFHLMCLVFFTISLVCAVADHKFAAAVLILAANIIYNLLPILLQQYNKLRIRKLFDKK